MTINNESRVYYPIEPEKGFSGAPDLYYECLICGVVVPSQPDDDITCTCRNIMLDVGYGRLKIRDLQKARMFRTVT